MSVREPLDGGDITAVGLLGKHQTRQLGSPVNEHAAAPAGPHVTASLGAEATCLVTQDVEQNRIAFDMQSDLCSVHTGGPRNLVRRRQHRESELNHAVATPDVSSFEHSV